MNHINDYINVSGFTNFGYVRDEIIKDENITLEKKIDAVQKYLNRPMIKAEVKNAKNSLIVDAKLDFIKESILEEMAKEVVLASRLSGAICLYLELIKKNRGKSKREVARKAYIDLSGKGVLPDTNHDPKPYYHCHDSLMRDIILATGDSKLIKRLGINKKRT